jgi:hypothetical protein
MILGSQIVSVHTALTGVQLYQFLPSDIAKLSWGRELSEVSRCEVEGPTRIVDEITPWLHWVSVWDDTGQTLHWTGPVQKVTYRRNGTTIEASDIGALMTRTRVPLTKQWEAADPSEIARELWAAMMDIHRLRGTPLMRRDPLCDPFNFSSVADEQMLDQLMDDLVNLGLCWSVVAGTPILGPAPRMSMGALGEDDFLDGDLAVVRDGTRVFTDVLVRGADEKVRARVNAGGLNLQTLVDVDDLFGLSNADRAARQYLRYCSRIREAVVLDGSARLHPDAPLTIESLVPSARVTVSAYGVLALMEVQSVQVTSTSTDMEVAVGLESVDDDPPELVTITDEGV